ncbi:MAG: LapA family protein [Rhodoferax sp.]
MKPLVALLRLALKAAIFFTLFAFTLNNQGDVTVHFFFGRQWSGPLVLVVLSAFACGLLLGVLGMVPRWWKQRRAAARARQAALAAPSAGAASGPGTSPTVATPPPAPTPDIHGI